MEPAMHAAALVTLNMHELDRLKIIEGIIEHQFEDSSVLAR
jgi:hypothetical protein